MPLFLVEPRLSEVQIVCSPFLFILLFTTSVCFMDHTFESYNQKYLFGKAHVDKLGIGQSLNHKGAKATEQLIQMFGAQQTC